MRALNAFAAVVFLGCQVGADTIAEYLEKVPFMNSGTVKSTDEFAWMPDTVSYMEPENVTCTACSWSVGGTNMYRYRKVPGTNEVVSPPLGMRSAPGLGGLSAGSVELRADGSLSQWTILNQGPTGSGKFGQVDEAWLAARINGEGRLLRTHPPAEYRSDAAVNQMNFSGAWPVTRLTPVVPSWQNDDVDVQLHAYSRFRPTDLETSALPAIVFTLTAKNRGQHPKSVDLMMNLPWGGITDCSRAGGNQVVLAKHENVAECMHMCNLVEQCASWQFDAGSGNCTLNSDVPLTAHFVGGSCGVKGSWGIEGDQTQSESLSFSQHPEARGPSIGEVTLMPVRATPGDTVSFDTSDSAQAMFEEFAKHGELKRKDGHNLQHVHGAASVSTMVPPGETHSISIVFAWNFPDRDFNKEILGNRYAVLGNSSVDMAQRIGTSIGLAQTLADITSFHEAVASVDNPTPIWLKDMLLNQWSHMHMLMWYRDGRLREYEAWSCTDVDSVHNDYQRHLIYLWAFPEFEKSKMEAWGTGGRADGLIHEYLSGFGANSPMDAQGGRTMGDTTSLYVLEVYELWRNTANRAALKQRWMPVWNGLNWMMNNAIGSDEVPYGLPQHLTCTYDHFSFENYQALAYNAHIYLTALQAGQELAAEMGDHGMENRLQYALDLGKSALMKELWNSTHSYFRAYTSDNAIMTDTLYGQMLAHHHFGNFTIPTEIMDQHLEYEWVKNQDEYGMRVISDPVLEDSIWLNGPPTWSYLQLVLGESQDAALEPLKRLSENYRSRINDLWNLNALSHTETTQPAGMQGHPMEQGHYAFMLTDLYLYPLLSGQFIDLPNGRLKLQPMFQPPYLMPVLAHGFIGSIKVTTTGTATFSCAFGNMSLPEKGLIFHGVPYPSAVHLTQGKSLTWKVDSQL